MHILFVNFRDNSQYFSSVLRNGRKEFINNIVKFIAEYKLDGIDIDWEFPVKGGAVNGAEVQ